MIPRVLRSTLDFDSYINERTQGFSGRRWAFEGIQKWLARNDGSRCFLLTGEPGSGKTALAARLAQFSAGTVAAPASCPNLSAGFLSAIHFCVARAGTWIDPISFARSISLQLAQRNQRFALALKNAGDRSVNIQVTQRVESAGSVTGVAIENLVLTGLNAQTAFNAAVVGPLNEIYQQGFDQPLAILVDALDEALAFKGEIGIPQLLASVDGLAPAVRFILTSRRDRVIESELMGAEIFALSSEKYDANNEGDIRSFVTAQLAGTAQAASADEISRQAGRNFQYVTFLLKQLQAGGSVAAGLPAGLDPLYRDSLARVVGRRDWGQDFAPVMGLLSVAHESLTETQLRNFSGFKEREISSRLAELRPFIEESGKPPAYRFYHQSVVDFLRLHDLELAGGSLINDYYLPAAEWHERLASYYVPDGPASWTNWDTYGLRYAVSHLAEAVREESNGNRAAMVGRLVGLVSNSDFRERRQREIGDMPALQRDLLEAVRCAAMNHDLRAIVPLVQSALQFAGFREHELRPRVVFDLAAQGQLEQAARRLELFEVDQEWIRAALLIIAWLGAESARPAAQALLEKVKPQSQNEQQLFEHARAAIEQAPPPPPLLPLDPPRPEEELAALVDWFGGKGTDPELLQRVVNDSFITVARGTGVAAGYFAEQDAPKLVSFAASHPNGDRYLHQYIAIHSGYQYVQYRNRSLWFVLAGVLRHPNPDWIRGTARELAETALAGSSLEFREALPLTVLALKAAAGDPAAAQEIVRLRNDAIGEASDASDATSLPNFNLLSAYPRPPAGTAAPQPGDDSWGSHRRRLAAHAQIMARLENNRPEAFNLVMGAAGLKQGFAGFQAPACLLLADTVLVANPIAQDKIEFLLNAASQAAHNVQDASFCLRITSRCNALRMRWWGPLDLKQSVSLLGGNPRAPELCALHLIGEAFPDRVPTGLPLPADVLSAATLTAVAAIYHCALPDIQRVNPGVDPALNLAPGTQVNIPDPGFATWIAARLSAELLANPVLADSERIAQLQLLVPAAAPNPTLMDTVLSRLLLAARPNDLAVLKELEELCGPPRIRSVAAYEARIPA